MYNKKVKCNYCKEILYKDDLYKTPLGLMCKDCLVTIRNKINSSNKPMDYYRQLLNNNMKF